MNNQNHGIQLNWFNKEKILIYNNNLPEWITSNEFNKYQINLEKMDDFGINNITYNKIIYGDNLLALKYLNESLNEEDKYKMIYIDPPYNTQSSFNNYDDNLLHSEWLSFIYDRLFYAKQILRNDGVIFIQIDDNEMAYIKVILDEIFGRNNFRNIFFARRTTKNINNQFLKKGLKSFNKSLEYILCYSKSNEFNFNPLFKESNSKRKEGYWTGFYNNVSRPTMRYEILGENIEEGQWKWSKEKGLEAVKNYIEYQSNFSDLSLKEYWIKTGKNKDFIRKNPNGGKGKSKGIQYWVKPSDQTLMDNNWADILAYNNSGYFQTAKSEKLLERIITCATNEGDNVLDFFGGSGTTGAVAEKLNRKWTLIEMGPQCITHCYERLKNNIKNNSGFTMYKINRH